MTYGAEVKDHYTYNNEILEDTRLLFMDGKIIRIGIIYEGELSSHLTTNLVHFIKNYEKKHKDDLLNWDFDYDKYADTQEILEEILTISLAYPHEIAGDDIISKKNIDPIEQYLLDFARNLTTEDLEIVFLEHLIIASQEDGTHNMRDIRNSLHNLRKKEILIPIDVDEGSEISDQEIHALAERVAKIPVIGNDEKRAIIMTITPLPKKAQVCIIATFMMKTSISLSSGESIENDFIYDIEKVKEIISEFESKAERSLEGEEPDQTRALKYYETASLLAHQWGLLKLAAKYEKTFDKLLISAFKRIFEEAETSGNMLLKNQQYDLAIESFRKAFITAEELYELGQKGYEQKADEIDDKIQECERGLEQRQNKS